MSFPKRKNCPGLSKAQMFSSHHNKGAAGMGQMLEMCQCQAGLFLADAWEALG